MATGTLPNAATGCSQKPAHGGSLIVVLLVPSENPPLLRTADQACPMYVHTGNILLHVQWKLVHADFFNSATLTLRGAMCEASQLAAGLQAP